MTEEHTTSERGKVIMTVVVIILIIAFLGYVFFGRNRVPIVELETIEYNHFAFEHVGGLWQTDIQVQDQLYKAVFRYNPKEVEDILVNGSLGNFSGPIYITFNPEQEHETYKYLALSTTELSLHLIRAMGREVIAACTSANEDFCQDRPLVTCADRDKNVIYLKPAGPTQVILRDNCVTLQGDEFELLKSVDRLLFKWYRIMHDDILI